MLSHSLGDPHWSPEMQVLTFDYNHPTIKETIKLFFIAGYLTLRIKNGRMIFPCDSELWAIQQTWSTATTGFATVAGA